jgi:hypothetical protein
LNINHYAADTIYNILHIRINFPILFNSIMAMYSDAILLVPKTRNNANAPLTEKKASPAHLTNAQENTTNNLSTTTFKSVDLIEK